MAWKLQINPINMNPRGKYPPLLARGVLFFGWVSGAIAGVIGLGLAVPLAALSVNGI